MSIQTVTKQGRPAVTSDEAMRIARLDAEAVYGDLSSYCITVFCGQDGWHVDYELTEPLIAGGGPHYVIDGATGQIIFKRYDQ
jgi:hypothetical protein